MSSEEPAEFVERILDDAVARHASDIYFLPRMDRLEVRYRGDGVQCDVESVPEECSVGNASRASRCWRTC